MHMSSLADPCKAHIWSEFRKWCAANFDSLDHLIDRFAHGAKTLTKDEFGLALLREGWQRGCETLLFKSLDAKGQGTIDKYSFTWFDFEKKRWKMQAALGRPRGKSSGIGRPQDGQQPSRKEARAKSWSTAGRGAFRHGRRSLRVESGPTSVNLGPVRPNSDHLRPKPSRVWLKLGHIWPELARQAPTLRDDFDESLPTRFAHLRPHIGRSLPTFAEPARVPIRPSRISGHVRHASS